MTIACPPTRRPAARTSLRVAGLAAVVGLALAVSGCASSSNDAAKALNPDPPGKMFADADNMLARGIYSDAARKFEDLDRDHPYAPEARRAMVMAAYSWYKAGKFPEAIASARRYTTMHPGTKEAALAHHIIASANFDEIKSPARDQTETRKALAELKVLRERYPDSPYAKQAENRIRIAEDVLAASEMEVGRYYLKRNNHVAAINRFKTVVAEYQTTRHVEEALFRITEANLSLGIAQEAQAAAAVLGHNFPGSEWYKDSHGLLKAQGLSPQADKNGWFGQNWKPQVQKAVPTPVKPVEGLPAPEQLPAPRKPPASDVPTASTKTRPMGLGAAL